MKTILLILIFLSPAVMLSQEQNQQEKEKSLHENINESGEIVVNLLNIFKKKNSNNSDLVQNELECEFCVKNNSTSRINIVIEIKEQSKELVVAPNTKECLCNIENGVIKYTCKNAEGVVIKKGEMIKKTEKTILTIE